MKNDFRKPTFFTSDLHLEDDQCIVFDKRPFRDLDHMHDVILKRYNAQVPESGICYFLGDIGRGGAATKEVIDQMNGTKVLILGNHDKKSNAMYNCGFDVVLYSASIMIAGERFTMSHCPLRGVFREDTEGMRGVTEYQNWHNEKRNDIFL